MIKIERHQKGNKRWYTVEGDERVAGLELVNCTSILQIINKPALVGWAQRNTAELYEQALTNWNNADGYRQNKPLDLTELKDAVKELRAAARDPMQLGTIAHEQIEQYLGRLIDNKLAPDMYWTETHELIDNNVKQFLVDHRITIKGTEVMAYHPVLKYGCTVDAWGHDEDNNLVVIDWKTGNVYQEAALQVAANTAALGFILPEMPSQYTTSGVVVHVDTQKSGYQVHEVNLSEAFERFKAALELSKISKTVWLEQ